jgi:Acyl-coenzyme A:6-aminopenicillanic acid acyl-transferase
VKQQYIFNSSSARHFLTRALLAAETFVEAQQILRDTGCGAGDAVSVNMTFLNQEGDRMFHNAEVGPALNNADQSGLSILTVGPGEHFFHCNK